MYILYGDGVHDDAPETFFLNEGEIDRLYMYNVDVGEDLLLDNKGAIKKISEM